jgi:hypothetical protein
VVRGMQTLIFLSLQLHTVRPFPEDLKRFTDGITGFIENLLDLIKTALVFDRPIRNISRGIKVIGDIAANLHSSFYHGGCLP